MALNFPNNPNIDDTYQLGNKTWIYIGDSAWKLQANVIDVPVATVAVTSFSTTSNGSVTSFDLGFTPASEEALIVSLDGVLQQPDSSYTLSGDVITFSSAPPNTVNIVATSMYTNVETYSTATIENSYNHANGAFEQANGAFEQANNIGGKVASGILQSANTIDEDITIETGYNAMSVGNVTVTANVTIPSGSRWVVI